MRISALTAFPMRVTGDSMLPTLPHGSRVLAIPVGAATLLEVGELVAARRPDRPEIELVKRIGAIITPDSYILLGDNPGRSTDSRHFGPVPRALITARVRWRYWPLPPRWLG